MYASLAHKNATHAAQRENPKTKEEFDRIFKEAIDKEPNENFNTGVVYEDGVTAERGQPPEGSQPETFISEAAKNGE